MLEETQANSEYNRMLKHKDALMEYKYYDMDAEITSLLDICEEVL